MRNRETEIYTKILKSKVKSIYDFTLKENENIKIFNEKQRCIYSDIFKKEIPKEMQINQKSLVDMLRENFIDIVTFYSLQTNKLVIEENKCTFDDIMQNIDNIFSECLNRITYNPYNNSYSIKFTSRRNNKGFLANTSFICRIITFLKNIKGESIDLREFNISKYEFSKHNFKPFKKYTIDENIAFKTFKKRKVLTIYFN